MAPFSPFLPLQTPVTWDYTGPRLTPGDRCFLLGSCFSQALGEFLHLRGQAPVINPLGPLYNPHSMADLLESFLTGVMPDWEKDLFEWRGLWRHPGTHTLLARKNRGEALEALAQAWTQGHRGFLESRWAVLTFGTPLVWEEATTGAIWANCHTLPAARFRRSTLTLPQLQDRWRDLLTGLEKNLLVSLSPIRYLEGGAEQNSYGKALLRIFLESLKDQGAVYFPAAEILLDQLRDYRWYARDMVHPSPEAEEYIAGRLWEKIAGAQVQEEAGELLKFSRRRYHRPLQGSSSAANHSELQELWTTLRTRIPRLPQNFNDLFPPKTS